MLRYPLLQMLMYWRVHSALKKTLANHQGWCECLQLGRKLILLFRHSLLPCSLSGCRRTKSKIHNFEAGFIKSKILTILFTIFSAGNCLAQDEYSQKFDQFTVHYSVFSSTAISAEVAQRYGLVRGKDRVIVNVAIIPNDNVIGGVAAEVSGMAANLMQQQKTLNFQEIAEPTAVYYLASLRHINREVFHFTFNVDPPGPSGPYTVKFTKTLYVNP